MIIIGEKINATRKAIAPAIATRDEQYIIKTALEQVAAGATYLDLNGGDPRPDAEVKNMEWLVGLVQKHTDVPLCLDSANPQALEVGLSLAKSKPIVNSVSLEKDRLEALLPVVRKHPCMVIGLCMADGGTPTSAQDRLERAEQLIAQLTAAGKGLDEIIIDPCFFPVSADQNSAKTLCQAIAAIRAKYPQVHVGGGLSNASYGLPGRRHVNLAMAAIAVYHGMDCAIVDPCTPGLMPIMLAAQTLSGADEWCANYVAAFRAGKLQ